ncbi:Serine/threonine-protein kinase gcn2 [Grifola frondosa]|uniref:non-specific serine/threonine protein kinase n=1 Tax=Grifola frondosa TaxID=5627 RepID=A0A1C7MMX3_GRIFR|nr:Serine/threonine-protein kinase gcn2 [Grifola frondosa]
MFARIQLTAVVLAAALAAVAVSFPKTYPAKAYPTFTIQQPVRGLNAKQITKLSTEIHELNKQHKGEEMVFSVVTFAQEWISENVVPAIEVAGSLATEMNKRASEEERARKQRQEEQLEQEEERAAQLAEEINEQIRADAHRQQLERERVQQQARKRATSDATETPAAEDTTPIESFEGIIEWKECLGTLYQADPVCEDARVTLPLELLSITFVSQYYTTPQAQPPSPPADPEEQRPAVTLQDVLEDSDSFREERATAIHSHELVHRGLMPKFIGLAPRDDAGSSKLVKVFKVGYHVRLLDLHRSNPFGFSSDPKIEEAQVPEGWLPRDAVESSLVYTKSRDIHAAGVILLQMLMGRDVMERHSDAQSALRMSSISPYLQQLASNMLLQTKKSPVTCLSLLAELAGSSSPVISSQRTPSIAVSGPRSPVTNGYNGSPETDYFRMPAPKTRSASRWKEDWEELELLGRGAFGSVVKARNKIDSRIYAVKKIKLRGMQSDKIFREVNALSRLNHRFIVRYYTTWVETSEPPSTAVSSDSEHNSGTADGMTSVPVSKSRSSPDDPFTIDLDDLGSESRHSFPSIHFTRSNSTNVEGSDNENDSSDSEDDAYEDLFRRSGNAKIGRPSTPPPTTSRTLYIQMEFVERQTLKERINEGLSEDEAWRLFQQILDALVHMSSLGILHHGKGDCKVGDFGLATSSLAAVDPSDLTHGSTNDAEMTLDVGTRLYIAPEVQSARNGPRTHAKADMYSLGIVFFEMNYFFSTASERVVVLEDLRKPAIIFPSGWEPHRMKQRQIITRLLQHNPNDRPTALELSQSSLMPERMEDEFLKNALKMISKPDSPHVQAVLSVLFNQHAKPVRSFLYDMDAELPAHVTLNGIVVDRLVEIFRLHGAVDMEPPLLMPVVKPEDPSRAMFLDRHGEVVALPNNVLVPFARLAARENFTRIKRFHVSDIYRPNVVAGHPRASKAAVFDIITPDLTTGPSAAAAEAISIVNDCLDNFANLGQYYEIHISHSKILEFALDRVPAELRTAVTDILNQTKSSQSQKRSMLLRKGISRTVVDELEILTEISDDIESILEKLEKVSPAFLASLTAAIKDIKSTIQFSVASGVSRPILFNPLMMSNHNPYFKDGVCFEVVRRNKRSDVLAAGGRYDNLIARFSPPKPTKSEPICAVAVQIALEKITLALAAFQSTSFKTLKEQRSFGFWSPRRCDVYVVSYQPGYLAERLEIAAHLWRHHISADVMYESGLREADAESHVEQCTREGILFLVYLKPRRDQSSFKVKSVLRGTEEEVTRQSLVPFLVHHIAEQKRVDVSLSGVPTAVAEGSQPVPAGTTRETGTSSDVQLLLPSDIKKQRRPTKQLFLDRAFDVRAQVRNAATSGMPTLAVDVPPAVFEEMTRSVGWVTDDDAWKPIAAAFPPLHAAYAHQVREAVARRKADGHRFVLLYAVREERVFLLTLT